MGVVREDGRRWHLGTVAGSQRLSIGMPVNRERRYREDSRTRWRLNLVKILILNSPILQFLIFLRLARLKFQFIFVFQKMLAGSHNLTLLLLKLFLKFCKLVVQNIILRPGNLLMLLIS